MPLNSAHLHSSVIGILKEIPMDKEASPDYPYQTKVDMYDNKCKGCGFMRIEVYPSNTIYNAKPIIFHNAQLAIDYVRAYGIGAFRVNRTCEYPGDLHYGNGRIIYPTLTEIVSNTCDFWDESKMMSYEKTKENDDIEFDMETIHAE